MHRLTNHKTAEALSQNVGALLRAGVEPSISDIRYLKLAEYEDAEEAGDFGTWISVDAALPPIVHNDFSDAVLVQRDNGMQEVAYLVFVDDTDIGEGIYYFWTTNDERRNFDMEEVTHWRSLPENAKSDWR